MKLKKKRKVILEKGGMILTSLSTQEKAMVKNKLTFSNPKYAQIMKYSKYGTTSEPEMLFYYETTSVGMKVPLGFDYSKLGTFKEEDNRVCPKIEAPKFVLGDLREEQKKAVESYLSLNQTPILNGVINLKTGMGKTILGLYLASKLNTPTLVLVHKDDLVRAWTIAYEECFGSKEGLGLIKASKKKSGEFVTIATVQTLNRMNKEDLEKLSNNFGVVIQDECHHAPASSFEIVNAFNARFRIGLTATAERSDGLTHVINLQYGGFCYIQDPNVKPKDILPVKVIPRELSIKFDPIYKKVGSKYEMLHPTGAGFFERLLPDDYYFWSDIPYHSRPKITHHLVDNFVVRGVVADVCKDVVEEFNKGRSCVVFLSQKEHCRIIYDYLSLRIDRRKVGIYYGDNNEKGNEEVLQKAESERQFVTITTYQKATEGTNVENWEVEFLVSSISNAKNVEQVAGRIRRKKEGKIDPVLIYDYQYVNVPSLKRHILSRETRYKKLGFDVPKSSHIKQFYAFRKRI